MSEVVQGAKSFSRTIKVLQLIADQPQAPSVAQLLALSELTRPTLYRILAALEAEGLVNQGADKCYQLGSRVISLAHRALAQTSIIDIARIELENLRDQLGETVHLAIRNQNELVYVDKIESREVVRMASTIGTRVPFHSSAVGKAFLAALSPDEASLLIEQLPMTAITPHSPTDKSQLAEVVVRTRLQGFSYESEENEQGIVCFGAAILNARGKPEASVSVSVPMFRLKEDVSVYSQAICSACHKISEKLGYIG